MHAQPETRFGAWQIVRALGAGAHGSLHLARDERNNRWAALKLLPLGDDEARTRFVGEAQALGRLAHPDIVGVLGHGQAGRVGWLAMEPLGGSDLRRYTRPARLLPEALVLDIGVRLALALAHAHERGVVHRDIKPSNVMVDWTSRRMALTDFGLARLDDASRTRSGVISGSPDYMAPELLAGAPANAGSDVYALGALLFELLAGRRPHEAESLGALLRRVATMPAPDLRGMRPDLAPAVADAVGQALQCRPADRPRGAAAFATALQAAAARLPSPGAST